MSDPQEGFDITVLGAGVVGICTAISLAEKGVRVRLIDRDAPGQATSFGNAGIVSPWSVVPQSMPGLWKKVPGMLLDPLGPISIRPGHLPRVATWGLRFLAQGRIKRVREISEAMDFLVRDSVTLFRQHLAGTGHENLLQDSMYVHAFRDARHANINSTDYEIRREKGAELEIIQAADLRDLEPDLNPDFKAAILIKGQARALSPGRICEVLTDKFRALGGTVLQAEIKAILPQDDQSWKISTSAGLLESPKIVLAMGVWAAELLKPLGIHIPMEAERGYHVEFSDPGVQLNNSIMDMDMKFVGSSMEGGLRVAGTAEFAGLDQPANDKRLQGLIKLASKLAPKLNTSAPNTWMGQRPSLPDSLPCIGEVDGFPNLISAFGHSHYGLMMAPKTGRVVADIATHTPVNNDLTAYNTQRY
ncbi:NAD(P)/FAD-dependent oxidoreductase [Halocynthiibacter sp.]|uniref:NAD(P)/FAD-dependent oxidoreductase n=1 Tax=Halocynthiibacter sp. TaxID=1979210 RepID=UPI003C4EA8F3